MLKKAVVVENGGGGIGIGLLGSIFEDLDLCQYMKMQLLKE